MLTLQNGVTIDIVHPSVISVLSVFVPLQGPQGPQGEPGVSDIPGETGNIQYIGNGPPGVIVGSKPGQTYLDQDSGKIYTLS